MTRAATVRKAKVTAEEAGNTLVEAKASIKIADTANSECTIKQGRSVLAKVNAPWLAEAVLLGLTMKENMAAAKEDQEPCKAQIIKALEEYRGDGGSVTVLTADKMKAKVTWETVVKILEQDEKTITAAIAAALKKRGKKMGELDLYVKTKVERTALQPLIDLISDGDVNAGLLALVQASEGPKASVSFERA